MYMYIYIYVCIHNCTYINPFPIGRKKADLVQKRKCDIPMLALNLDDTTNPW